MRAKLELDFNRPIASQYATLPAEATEVQLTWNMDEFPSGQRVAAALSALPNRFTKVDLSGNFLWSFGADLATALSGLPRSVTSVMLCTDSLYELRAQDLRNALISLGAAGVSSADLSWTGLDKFGAEGLGDILTDLPFITLDLSGNELRSTLGTNGLNIVLAAVSARCLKLSEDDLDLNDEDLTNLLKNMSPTVNEIRCENNIIMERVNRTLSVIRQHSINNIEESIPNLPIEPSPRATHGFWRPSSPVDTNNNTDDQYTKEEYIDDKEANKEEDLDPRMIIR